MMRAAFILVGMFVSPHAMANEGDPMLDCIRDNVVLSNVTYAELGDGIKLPRVTGQITNGLPWAITGFRFDYGVTDTATSTIWKNELPASDLLDPPLEPGETRKFNTIGYHFDVADENTIVLSPLLWDVTDPEGLEVIDDQRAVTAGSYQLARSQRTCG